MIRGAVGTEQCHVITGWEFHCQAFRNHPRCLRMATHLHPDILRSKGSICRRRVHLRSKIGMLHRLTCRFRRNRAQPQPQPSSLHAQLQQQQQNHHQPQSQYQQPNQQVAAQPVAQYAAPATPPAPVAPAQAEISQPQMQNSGQHSTPVALHDGAQSVRPDVVTAKHEDESTKDGAGQLKMQPHNWLHVWVGLHRKVATAMRKETCLLQRNFLGHNLNRQPKQKSKLRNRCLRQPLSRLQLLHLLFQHRCPSQNQHQHLFRSLHLFHHRHQNQDLCQFPLRQSQLRRLHCRRFPRRLQKLPNRWKANRSSSRLETTSRIEFANLGSFASRF